KYKVIIALRSNLGALNVVEGKVKTPTPLGLTATATGKDYYSENLETFNKADSNALFVLTTNMTEDTLKLVMRVLSSWNELSRLFDLCLKFFSYKTEIENDIANHTSKLKNVWNDLNLELTKGGSSDLPELDYWDVDNGSFSHVVNRKDIFLEYTQFDNDSQTVTTANGNSVKAVGKGSVEIQASVDGKWQNLTLTEV
ncbi:hypothetical protein ILUMI_17103, partial [Ignelater luminosus]